MRADSRRLPQQRAAIAAGFALCVLAGCAEHDPPPSIWPPADFRCEVEEVTLRDGVLQVTRRASFDASGLVVYGTAARSLVDAETRTALPVFDRLAVYRLEPSCVRLFARKLDQRGVATIDAVQGERGATDDAGVVLRWRAFGGERTIAARGRVHGSMADILATVCAHLPNGERFTALPADERPVVPMLRGVPDPAVDGAGALQVYTTLLTQQGDDEQWLLDAYALACAGGKRAAAEAFLQRWSALDAARRAQRAATPFPDEKPPGLSADVLRRLLPPQPAGQ